MIVTHKIEMDLARPWIIPPVPVMQDDKYSRNIEFTVFFDGSPLALDGAKALIRFAKQDGTGGNYDTLPDGTTAYTIAGNVLTVALAPQVCTAAGKVFLAVAVISGETYLHTFTVTIQVHRNPGLQVVSENYVKILGALPDAGWLPGMYLATDDGGKVVAVEDPAADAVRYTAQNLAEAQQMQARKNQSLYGKYAADSDTLTWNCVEENRYTIGGIVHISSAVPTAKDLADGWSFTLEPEGTTEFTAGNITEEGGKLVCGSGNKLFAIVPHDNFDDSGNIIEKKGIYVVTGMQAAGYTALIIRIPGYSGFYIDGTTMVHKIEDEYIPDSVVKNTAQELTETQQTQARANIKALKVPTVAEVTREEFLSLTLENFTDSLYTVTPQLDWMDSLDDFDFALSCIKDGVSYTLTKENCQLTDMASSGHMWACNSSVIPGASMPLLIANGANPSTLQPEDAFKVQLNFTPESCSFVLYRLQVTEKEISLDEKVQQTIEDYMAENPVEVTGVVKTVNGVSPDENGNVKISSVHIGPTQPTDGTLYWLDTSEDVAEPVTYTVTNTLTNVTSDNTAETVNEGESYTAAITANDGYTLSGVTVTMGGEDITSTVYADGKITIAEVTGDIVITAAAVENVEVTLSGISAVYSGGDVTVGTDVSALTGIVVTATYSDGSTATVTDYTLSGTIAEGSNTVTVTYEGMTTTFTVTGVTESGGEETTTYTITNNLTNVTNDNAAVSIAENAEYLANLTVPDGYEFETVTITMGGTDVTADVLYGSVINIPAVTGDVVITATSIEGTWEEFTLSNKTGGTTWTIYSDDGTTQIGTSGGSGCCYSGIFDEDTTVKIEVTMTGNLYKGAFIGSASGAGGAGGNLLYAIRLPEPSGDGYYLAGEFCEATVTVKAGYMFALAALNSSSADIKVWKKV